VRGTPGEEAGVKPHDLVVDPGIRPLFTRLSAPPNNVFKGAVAADLENLLTHGAAQPTRDMDSIEWKDAAATRVDPEQLGIVGRFGHREDPGSVGPDQNIGGQPQQTRLRSSRTPDKPLEPVNVIIAVDELGSADEPLMERDGRLDPVDNVFLEGAAQPHQAFVAALAVHHEL
jgi:hypothetical protein